MWPAAFTAAVVTWGATAYNYMNTGFSVAMIVFALFAIYTLVTREKIPAIRLDRRLIEAFAIFYASLFVSTLFHLDAVKNLYGGYFSAFGFLLYTLPLWMLLYIGWNRDIRKIACLTLYIILYALCLYGIGKYILMGESRLSSFYHFPTRIGMMLDMFLPFTAAIALYYRKKSPCFFKAGVALLPLELVTLYLAEVRGSMMGLSAAVVVTLLLWLHYQGKSFSRKNRILLIGGAVLFVLAAVLYAVFLRWGNMNAMMGGERFLMWESSWHMWLDHPLTGIGLNGWQAAYASGPYHPAAAKEAGQIMPHNVFIYFFATAVLLGGLGYVAYCVLVFLYLLHRISRHQDDIFGWALLFAFIASTVHGLTDQTFILKLTGRIFYMLMGISLLFEKWEYRES